MALDTKVDIKLRTTYYVCPSSDIQYCPGILFMLLCYCFAYHLVTGHLLDMNVHSYNPSF